MNPEEERALIEQYYRQAIAGAASDEEELAVAHELLQKARRGFVVDDQGRGLIYARDPELPVDADFLVDEGALRQQRLRGVLPFLAALLVAAVAVLLVYGREPASVETVTPTMTVTQATWLSLPTKTLTPTPTATTNPTSTPAPTQTPTPAVPTPSPTPVTAKEVKVKAQPVQLEEGAVVPVSLELAGRFYPVVPTGLRDGQWAYLPDPERASWLAGSAVNVVLGLPHSDENLTLLAATLGLSDTLTLRNSVAGAQSYCVMDKRHVGVYETEVLSQRRAGLTLLLLGGGEDPERRLVLQAVPCEGAVEQKASGEVGPGLDPPRRREFTIDEEVMLTQRE